MKYFIDPKGKFAIKIPIDWEYRNAIIKADETAPHSFELYDNPVGCFQISCHDKNHGKIHELISKNRLTPQKLEHEKLILTEKIIYGDNFDAYFWMAIVKDDFILIKYVYEAKKRKLESTIKELKKVRKSLPTIVYIKPENQQAYFVSDKFNKFMSAIGACIDLINRAYENGAFIELVILTANQIDALLRLSLILHYQIRDKNKNIETHLIFQDDGDKPIMEKKIYSLALDQKILSQDLYDQLFELYNERNKVVHRYIITDIKTKEVMKIVQLYGNVLKKIESILESLERRQYKLGIGIYGTDIPPNTPPNELRIKRMIANVKDKHGNKKFNENLTFKIK